MILEKYGIQLRRITKVDLELIRQNRNSQAIASKMIFRKHITAEQQLKWFDSINNVNNIYCLILYNGKAIGLINDKDMDWHKGNSESGLFVWDKDCLKTIIPSLASLCLLELGYEMLNWNEVFIKVLKTNIAAIAFNKQLGFKLLKIEGSDEVAHFYLNKRLFEKKVRRSIVSMTKLSDIKTLKLILDEVDEASGLSEKIENRMLQSENNIRKVKKENVMHYCYDILGFQQ